MLVLNQNKYSIEYRILQDSKWFSGFMENEVQWSEWKLYNSYFNLNDLTIAKANLEAEKKKLSYTKEYRIVKDA